MASILTHDGEDGLRERLQLLLDDKEKQLQLAGTLGQRILAQQMELEDRINQLPLTSSSLVNSEEPQQQEDVRDKLKELQRVLSSWENENSAFFSKLAAQASNAKRDQSENIDVFQAPGLASSSTPVDTHQPSALQSSRRAKNAAHRADDVEFAFEIGSGLLTEVRRLQSLLGERDKAIQDMKEEKDDLERSNASLHSNLLAQEQNTDKFKEENWNLEVTLQELRTQSGDLQSSNVRLESEQKRLVKQLAHARESADKLKAENESLGSSLAELKAKHETDVAQMRKNAASLQRDKSDLQTALESLKSDAEKRNRALRTLGSENGALTKPSPKSLTDLQLEEEMGMDVLSSHASPPSPTLRALTSDDPFDPLGLAGSPPKEFSKSIQEELDNYKRSYLHAQRQIASLKNSLMKEKELRLEQKRRGPGILQDGVDQHRRRDGEEEEEEEEEEGEEAGEEEEENGDQENTRRHRTKGRRRSRPRKQPKHQTPAKEAGLRRVGVAPSATSSEKFPHIPPSIPFVSPSRSDVSVDPVARASKQDSIEELDPAFNPDIDELGCSPLASSPMPGDLHQPVPSHLALELGISKTDSTREGVPFAQDTSSRGQSATVVSQSVKLTGMERKEASTQTDLSERNRVHISIATESFNLVDADCQTDPVTPFSASEQMTGSPAPTTKVSDSACQTDPLESIAHPSRTDTPPLSTQSLPFRFISSNNNQRIEVSSPVRSTGTNVQVHMKPGMTEEVAAEEVLSKPTVHTVSNTVDRSVPPMITLPPPPAAPPPPKGTTPISYSMPPPAKIPERKNQVPARPLSPPPRELIQRATTPIPARGNTNQGRQELSGVAEAVNDRRSEISLKDPSSHHTRHHSSSASVVSDFHSSGPSRRSSLSSSHFNTRREANLLDSGLSGPQRMQYAGENPASSTDPNIIHAITQTMIGEFLYKYTRRTIGKGYGDKRHKRYFWVHPYTKTIYWSSSDPSAVGVAESNAKSAFIESVRSVLDPNPLPPGIYQYSVVVSTPQREMKFTAPSKERHDIWITALNFLLSRPASLPHSPEVRRADKLGMSSSHLPRPSTNRMEGSGLLSSPQSGRTLGSSYGSDAWNITPRAHPTPSTPLSQLGSVRRRPGTPAAEYMRWGSDVPNSPDREFEQIIVQPGEADFDFEIHDDLRSEGDFDGLENVRTCCDGAHTIGKHHRDDHLHHVEFEESQRPAYSHVRPVSPSGWSFRSRSGSSRANDGSGNLFNRSRNR